MSPKDCAYIVERLAIRFMAMVADHERQLSDHRTSFGARTEADAKIIAGLRSEIGVAQMAVLERDSLMSERDGLLTKVQDMRAEMQRLSAQLDWERAEIKRLQWENLTMHKDAEDGYTEAIKVLGDPIALSKERDALRAEVAALKSQTPKHPVKVGEWVKRTAQGPYPVPTDPIGAVRQVVSVADGLPDGYEYVIAGGCWSSDYCEPCDPPNHDTEAGKEVAEAALKTEPVAEPIKVGDVAKVVGASGDLTAQSDIGKIGEVLKIDFEDGTVLLSGGAGWVNHRDVRKVTT